MPKYVVVDAKLNKITGAIEAPNATLAWRGLQGTNLAGDTTRLLIEAPHDNTLCANACPTRDVMCTRELNHSMDDDGHMGPLEITMGVWRWR